MYRDHLIRKLEEVALGMRKIRTRVYAEKGLQAGQVRVLSSLFEHGSMSQADICRLHDIAGPTVKKLVSNLVTAGFVSVAESGSDKRLRIVSLTDAGRKQEPIVEACTREMSIEAASGLSEPEIIMTGMLLAKISENLRNAANPDYSGSDSEESNID